ncbi:MAG: orotate phosphoribosyltransferase [Bacteroidales bacterium]|jgi:orotate phosphoribosyltransferase|nr:orotate phosphoribosyltransferase [Bacteroidales bacterium]MDN5328573.1 orotate phosphoribosyltransferase [Bacteroidales bacterium]
MTVNQEVAKKIAENLLQIKAVKLNPSQPFTWASGWKSPIYCDNRITLSYPKLRTFIRQEFTRLITEEFGIPDVIAGVATGGIPQGVLVAQDLGLPFVYVRQSEKSHGLGNVIEGVVEPGQSVIVVEDLISTGGSSLKAVEALRKAGCVVKGMVAIFSYKFPQAEDAFQEAKVRLLTLSDYEILISTALEQNYILQKDMESLIAWRRDPAHWGK